MLIALLVIGVTLAALYFFGRARMGGFKDVQTEEPAEIYLGLRNRALATTAQDMGVAPSPDGPVAYGVVMDLGMASGTATIVSLSTGDTSMYTSRGGGIIGGIGHETCRNASKHFIAVAQAHLGRMRQAALHPLPPRGIFRFHVLTTEGVFVAEDKEEVITRGQGDWAELFRAGDNVITQIRLTAPPG